MATALPGIIMITAGVAFYLLAIYWNTHRPQHSGSGEGALTVHQLIAHVEAERRQRERTGRHRLREPHPQPPPSTPDAPPLELHHRAHEALRHP
ncbi:hypothetical protein SAMN05216506_116154 [Saccharopolyspora kobensis]|uniref:Uncharacterized protein n=1 Tax=Saccharopolyspora kobensis TaxID=146035 RepID=A0ABY1E678_9PSEU|nr:hypothetical protein [Saccharopolyspora kobensis]SFE96547.1 hypothetical protein SAMN05216506_116154 [Saccharopolyspora kobensis]